MLASMSACLQGGVPADVMAHVEVPVVEGEDFRCALVAVGEQAVEIRRQEQVGTAETP
jgi:hypothetical protein